MSNESQETKTAEEVKNWIGWLKKRISPEISRYDWNYIEMAMKECLQRETKHLTEENERFRKELEDVDEVLMHVEDFTHGKDGDMITRARHSITTTLHNNK